MLWFLGTRVCFLDVSEYRLTVTFVVDSRFLLFELSLLLILECTELILHFFSLLYLIIVSGVFYKVTYREVNIQAESLLDPSV